MQQLIHLKSAHSDVILKCSNTVELVYWGKKLNAALTESMLDYLDSPVPNGGMDNLAPFSLVPEEGLGLFISPGLEGHRKGQDWSPLFTLKNQTILDNQVQLILVDEKAGLELNIEFTLDKTGVIKTRNRLINLKEETYSVNRFAVTLPLLERAKELMAFNGRWVKEFGQHRTTIDHCGYLQENRKGRTSHEYFPGMMIGTPHFTESRGDVWGVHLAWSGNHRMQVAVQENGKRFVQAEALYAAGEISLQQNEMLETPWVYATYSDHGLNAMSQHFHNYVRQKVLNFKNNKARPVHLNTWEGIYFDHDPNYIKEMATQSAKMGVERFIIDDGWFGVRDNDLSGLGDWFLDERKYPNGLKPVIDHVKSLGMEFGIWVEPEMINKDSNLYRNHPDWLLELSDYDQPAGRNQYVLDLQNPAVFAYLKERLTWLLSRHEIDYLKWDMNRPLVQAAHLGQAAVTKQTEALYKLLDELKNTFPNVEIESCASGGGRIDYEILKRTDRFWTSDSNDALERQTIQRGMSYFFPPEVMGAHIGSEVCHVTGRSHSINLRGLTALMGHMGVELDPVKVNEQEKATFAHYIALHKQLRTLLHSGDVFRLEMDDDKAQAVGVVSKDKTEAVFVYAQLAMPTYSLAGSLYFDGLEPDQIYQIEILDLPHNNNFETKGWHTMKKWPTGFRNQPALSGEWMMNVGLPLPILDPETAMLVKLTAKK